MRNLKGILFSVYILLACVATTPLMAGSAKFTGIFETLYESAVGVQFDGNYSDEQRGVTRGIDGRAVPFSGVEFGIDIPIGETFFVGIGGVKSFAATELTESNNVSEIIVSLFNHKTWDIQPRISLWGNTLSYVNDIVKIENRLGITVETSPKMAYGNITVGFKF